MTQVDEAIERLRERIARGHDLFGFASDVSPLLAEVERLRKALGDARKKALEEAAAFIESEQNEPHWGQDNNRRTAQTTIAECAALIRSRSLKDTTP